MSVPSFQEFIYPLLCYLAEDADGSSAGDAYEAVANKVELAPEAKLVMLPSRAIPVYKNRIGWAHDRLKRAGLSAAPKRGFWKITEAGLEAVRSHPSGFDADELHRIARPGRVGRQGTAGRATAGTHSTEESAQSPTERIDEALAEHDESIAADLLDHIARSSPLFFERLVLELLHAMGYGGSEADVHQVGGSSDGGIDGIISLDQLGLEKVYVQAKRWQNTVGRPQIQGFSGALAGQHARKGVFITTSDFTDKAIEFAKSVSDSIVLVDGQQLANLMIKHGVGVHRRPLHIAEVDSDFFDELQ